MARVSIVPQNVSHVQIVPQHLSLTFPPFPDYHSSKRIPTDEVRQNEGPDHERDRFEQILERVAKLRLESPTGQHTGIEFSIRLHSDRSWDGGCGRCIQTLRDRGPNRSSDRNRARGGALHGHTLAGELSPTDTRPRLDVPNGIVRELLQRDGRAQVLFPPRESNGRQ